MVGALLGWLFGPDAALLWFGGGQAAPFEQTCFGFAGDLGTVGGRLRQFVSRALQELLL